jgi:hypothetical protein
MPLTRRAPRALLVAAGDQEDTSQPWGDLSCPRKYAFGDRQLLAGRSKSPPFGNGLTVLLRPQNSSWSPAAPRRSRGPAARLHIVSPGREVSQRVQRGARSVRAHLHRIAWLPAIHVLAEDLLRFQPPGNLKPGLALHLLGHHHDQPPIPRRRSAQLYLDAGRSRQQYGRNEQNQRNAHEGIISHRPVAVSYALAYRYCRISHGRGQELPGLLRSGLQPSAKTKRFRIRISAGVQPFRLSQNAAQVFGGELRVLVHEVHAYRLAVYDRKRMA